MNRSIATLPLLALLSAAPAPDSATEPAACVSGMLVAGPVVREDGRLYFRGEPDRRQSYIAGFKGGSCPGLNAFSAVAIESMGNRYCEGDKVRALNLPARTPGAVCILDTPQPFSGKPMIEARRGTIAGAAVAAAAVAIALYAADRGTTPAGPRRGVKVIDAAPTPPGKTATAAVAASAVTPTPMPMPGIAIPALDLFGPGAGDVDFDAPMRNLHEKIWRSPRDPAAAGPVEKGLRDALATVPHVGDPAHPPIVRCGGDLCEMSASFAPSISSEAYTAAHEAVGGAAMNERLSRLGLTNLAVAYGPSTVPGSSGSFAIFLKRR